MTRTKFGEDLCEKCNKLLRDYARALDAGNKKKQRAALQAYDAHRDTEPKHRLGRGQG